MPHSEWPTSVPVMLNRPPRDRPSAGAVRVVPTHRSSDRPLRAPPRLTNKAGPGHDAGAGDGNFSVRYANDSQNRSAGASLAAWYNSDRILHFDRFYVNISQPSRQKDAAP
ncbi:hypothetical protein ACWIG5_37290, partial [Streptomyces lydicus]